MKYLFPLCALLSVACTGILDGRSGSDQKPGNPSSNQQTNNGSAGTASSTPSQPTDVNAGPPFKVRNTEPELIPFEMRVRRIAAAIGVQTDNPMFATMTKNALKLGDYDYANGALPDSSWNANRIAAWIDALKPVCASPEMKAKYPALPDNLPQLVRAAWGHLPSDQDTADFKDALAASGADATIAYESTCMAVFTAAEFVYR
ncbi:MAG TPA: hypothetical protein VHB79_20895 [Polyangiaceae bacterium]|nr:hypothetical protein [Polyangiaceae bacterium]